MGAYKQRLGGSIEEAENEKIKENYIYVDDASLGGVFLLALAGCEV